MPPEFRDYFSEFPIWVIKNAFLRDRLGKMWGSRPQNNTDQPLRKVRFVFTAEKGTFLIYPRRKLMSGKPIAKCVLAIAILAAGSAQADVFNMPAGQTSLQFVTVGDPGNAADTLTDGTGYGSVGYTYQMGKYDVTVGQYSSSSTPWRRRTPTACTTATWHRHGYYADGRNHPKRQSGQLQLRGHGQLQPGRQLSDLRCLLGRCRPLLQLAAKRSADRG